jgi:hypothetical protein
MKIGFLIPKNIAQNKSTATIKLKFLSIFAALFEKIMTR